MSNEDLPLCSALIFAQIATSDSGTGCWNIIGAFDKLTVPDFDHPVGIAVYFALCDSPVATRRIRIEFCEPWVDIIEPSEGQTAIVGSLEGDVNFSDRFESIQGSAVVMINFKQPGSHICRLLADGQFVFEKRLLVLCAKEKPQ